MFIVISCIALRTFPQSTAGITNKRDTSFTTYQAYLSTKKTHPDIKMVEELAPGAVIELKNLRYSFYGEERQDTLFLDAFLHYPKKIDKSIAIIILHGGGWRTGDRSQHYPLAQRLAKLGYACFTPEYRLSTEALYPAAVLDIKTAIQWVRVNAKAFNVDTNKIMVAGFSAGGEVAGMIGLKYDAGNASDTDPVERVSSRPDFNILIYPFYRPGSAPFRPGAPPEPRVPLALMPVVNNEQFPVLEGAPPVFMICTTDDPSHVVPTVQFYLELQAKKVPTEMHIYEYGEHGFGLRPTKKPGSPVENWPARMMEWLTSRELIKSS